MGQTSIHKNIKSPILNEEILSPHKFVHIGSYVIIIIGIYFQNI